MPNEVIAQVHRLAVAAEKYDGKVFTNMQGKILTEQFNNEEDTDEDSIATEDNKQTSYMEEHAENESYQLDDKTGNTNDNNTTA